LVTLGVIFYGYFLWSMDAYNTVSSVDYWCFLGSLRE
jgi:hypothetical protein